LRVHLLHISKTGGTALRQALEPAAASHGLILHDHFTLLRDVPSHEHACFVVRDPVTRFVSGFNSRLRMGRPLIHMPWTDAERWAFDRFRTPNELAEALSADQEERREDAVRAMAGIRHVNMHQSEWLHSVEYLVERRDSIAFVGFQPRLSDDFARLKARLALPDALTLPRDPVRAHATPVGFDTSLSPPARENVARWYARDAAIVEYLAARSDTESGREEHPV
jgi:hypothetical protein